MRCSASGAGREVRARLWGGALAGGRCLREGMGHNRDPGPRVGPGAGGGGGCGAG